MTNCLKIIDAMPQADQDALLTRLENYQAVGMTPKQAQMEAAKETLKQVEAEMPAVQQSARSPLGFYSALAESIESIATKQQPAGGWLAQIKGLVNKGTVKQDEVEWSGLTDWMALQEGKITKQQVLDYLEANGVQVQETVLGAPEKVFDVYRKERGGRRGAHQVSYGTEEDAQAWIDDRDADEGEFMIEELADEDNPTATKYEQYSLPGGKNYREVLLKLPAPEFKPTPFVPTKFPDGKTLYKEVEQFIQETAQREYEERGDRFATKPELEGILDDPFAHTDMFSQEIEDKFGLPYRTYAVRHAERSIDASAVIDRERVRHDDMQRAESIKASKYQSSHWDTPNVLAHLRVNDRIDADGAKVLFVEELQSDWGQQGKKKGFGAAEPVLKPGYTMRQMEDNRWRVEQEGRSFPILMNDTREGALQAAVNMAAATVTQGPPVAPFVGKTDGWLNLALKRAIIMAVEGGYSKIAFVNGEQSAERYSLSKQIDRIDYTKNGDGTFNMSAIKGGTEVFSKEDMAEAELEATIGKELAQKMVSGAGKQSEEFDAVDRWEPDDSPMNTKDFDYDKTFPKTLAGLDLNVGGEGMKKFYDAIVPNAAKSLLKKLGGGQMESVALPKKSEMPDVFVTEVAGQGIALFNQRTKRFYNGDTWTAEYLEDAKKFASRDQAKSAMFDMGAKELNMQPGFTITPEMIEKVGAGVPLFSKRDTQAAQDAGFDTDTVWYHGTTAKDFKAFRQGKNGINELGEGIYFTDKPVYAEAWAGRSDMGGRIIPAYLKKGDIFDLGAKRDLIALAKRIKATNPVTDAERQAKQIRADKSVTEWTPEESRIVNDASMDLWRTWLLESDDDLAKQIGRGDLSAWLARANYVGAKNDNSQIPGQVVVFDAKNIRSPWAKFNPKKAGSANILHSQRDPYANAPDNLMGLRKYGPQKAFGEQAYKHVEFVRVSWDDGEKMVEAMTGLNKPHALERARRNWKTAKIEAISRAEAEAEDPTIGKDVDAALQKSQRDLTDTKEFKTWSQGLDLVEAGEEYAGGPAVFTVYHGTTHSDITKFERVGQSEGFLGKGPYFTTDPEDASENYAGIGPDLTIRIERTAENIYDTFEDDAYVATQMLEDYFQAKGIKAKITDKNFEEFKVVHGNEAINHAATKAVKGDTDGLMMKAYVRMSNPADTTGNSPDLTYERVEDEDGTITDETGTAVDWVLAARDVGERYGIGRSMEEHIDDVLGDGGEINMKGVFDSVSKRLSEAYDEQSELLSPGAIFAEIAEEAGYDGVIMDAGLHFGPRKVFGGVAIKGMKGVKTSTLHMVPFSATQVKSATGNSGAFDPANPDIRKSYRPESSRFDDMVYKMQNKMIDTKRVVDAITATVGQIADDLNVYLQEELFHGRAAKRVADFGKEELKPLMEQIGRDGFTIADVEEYLQARHAPEANQVIAQRNPNDPGLQDGGSGMTNAAAAAYMAGLSADDAQKLSGIAAQVNAIIRQTRQLYVSYNLESQDTVDAWEQMFQNYIPLQREDKEGRMGIGQGFSVKGKETKGRTGSTRRVVDVLANIALQREKLIVRGEKNRVATALVGLALANPDPDLWSVGPPPSTRVYDPKTNTVVDRVDPMYKSRDEVLVAKVNVNGKIQEMAVVFNQEDPRALRMVTALKNLDANSLEGVLAASAIVTRYFSAVNTQYNPVFGVVNLVRDVQGAMINIGETPLAGKRVEIAKNTLSALAGIYADMRAERSGGTGSSAWAQLFEEFELEGGQTGFRDLFKTSSDRAEALQKILTPDAWMNSKLGKIFTINGKLKVPMSEARKGAGWIFDWLSDYNGAMENAVRLSAYKAAKDLGLSKQQAASLAKNLTVNFNRKGQAGQQAGALYAFFNAAMQGTARIGQTLFTMQPGKPKTIRLSSTGKRIVYGGILLGATQALLLAAAGFGDDDPPEFLRERSLIIPVGGKKYISIPMPLGYHVIPGIGRHAAEFALSGFKKPQKRVVSMIGMFMDAFNPIGNAGLSMQTIAPTALDPFVALRENKDWTGKPIARTSSNQAIPGHTQFKDTATAPAKWAAEMINLITGGNDYVAGVLSPTPDQIDYLFGQVTGGVGRELSKIEQTVKAVVTGEELPTFKVPLAGRFFGNADSQASQASAFYDNVNKLNELETEVKGMQKDGKAAEAALILRGRPDAYLIAKANVAERQVQRLRREKRELLKKGAERSAIKAKEAQITETMKRLNAAMAQ